MLGRDRMSVAVACRERSSGLAFNRSIPVHRLLLPASAECPVKLHETLVLSAARLRECEFRGKERALAVQDFEISGGASLVTHFGQPNGFLQVLDRVLLANSDLMQFLVTDQRIGHVPEGALNRLPVSDQGGFMLRFRKPQISAKSSPRENGLAHLGAVRPDSDLRAH